MLILENTFLERQVYVKLVTMLLSVFADASLSIKVIYMFPKNFNSLSKTLIIF